MLERFHQQEEPATILSALPSNTPVLYPETMSDAEIEDYLDQAYAAMIGRVGYEGRQRMRQELRARLESLISAYQELGYSRAEAIALTLQPIRTEATALQNTVSQDLKEE